LSRATISHLRLREQREVCRAVGLADAQEGEAPHSTSFVGIPITEDPSGPYLAVGELALELVDALVLLPAVLRELRDPPREVRVCRIHRLLLVRRHG
jgi:hypothetical protein